MQSNQIDLHVTLLKETLSFCCWLPVSVSHSQLNDIENCRHSTFTKKKHIPLDILVVVMCIYIMMQNIQSIIT